MGMTCALYRVSASEIAHLRASPEAVQALLSPPGSVPPVVEVREKGIGGWILRLFGVKVTQVDPTWEPPAGIVQEDDRQIDLDRAWHGLHYILTGTAWEGEPPACFLLAGGEEIGDENDDDRPRLLEPNQVRQLSAFLAAISDEEFRRRFDPERMAALEIYPESIWKRIDDRPSPLDYLRGGFDDLRAFVATSADRGEAIVVHIG